MIMWKNNKRSAIYLANDNYIDYMKIMCIWILRDIIFIFVYSQFTISWHTTDITRGTRKIRNSKIQIWWHNWSKKIEIKSCTTGIISQLDNRNMVSRIYLLRSPKYIYIYIYIYIQFVLRNIFWFARYMVIV